MTAEDRFWAKVDKSGDCWEWTAARQPFGYGNFYWDGQAQPAHRVSYMLNVGPIPVGKHVMHRCDNPPCVRPDHLLVGTHRDNVRDMLAKGRHAYGERSGHRKIDAKIAVAIWACYQTGEALEDIAARYGVSAPTVCEIGKGKKWARSIGEHLRLDGAAVPTGSDGAA